MYKILVIHGPNLNMLSIRETNIYGNVTLSEINERIYDMTKSEKIEVTIRQSNREGELVEIIQDALGIYHGIVINPAAYTHTSVAIRDAILAVNIPTIEVHISNIYKREDFRHHSYISDIVLGKITGFGINSYLLGIKAVTDHLKSKNI
ncbi:MAG: type II 3-dehydroquinate dehydratase [Nitrospirota bacterium]